MSVVGTRDVNDIDVFPLNQLSPVRFDRRVTPLVSECLRTLGTACADSLKDRNIRHVEEATHLQECVGMRAAHKAVPDETDVEIVFCHLLYSCAQIALAFAARSCSLSLRACIRSPL